MCVVGKPQRRGEKCGRPGLCMSSQKTHIARLTVVIAAVLQIDSHSQEKNVLIQKVRTLNLFSFTLPSGRSRAERLRFSTALKDLASLDRALAQLARDSGLFLDFNPFTRRRKGKNICHESILNFLRNCSQAALKTTNSATRPHFANLRSCTSIVRYGS